MTLESRRCAASIPIWLFATGYFIFNALTQGLVSPTADLDQAQQLVLSQDLSWGYGAQPPLYTWLVYFLFTLTGGPNVWVLLALKAALLSILVLGFLRIGSELGFDSRRQLLAVVGLALIPQIIWESQRDLTHSVLATVVATWTLWSVLSLHRRPSVAGYVLFGALAGLGLLSKYNFGVFLLGLLLAVLLTPGYRRHLLTQRSFISLGMTLLILLPHLIWLMTNADLALASSHKLGIDPSFSLAGIWALLVAILAFLGPLLLAYGLSWRSRGSAEMAAGMQRELLSRLLLIILIVLLVFVLGSGATHVKDRWLQPLLFFVPILMVAMGIGRTRIYLGMGVAMMLVASLLLPGRTLLAQWSEKTSRPNLPYAHLGQELRGKIGVPDIIFSNKELLAGNMRLVFPETRIEVVKSSAELRQKQAYYPDRKLFFLTDNGGRQALGAHVGKEETLDGKAMGVLEHSYLYVPTLKHRVYWLAI